MRTFIFSKQKFERFSCQIVCFTNKVIGDISLRFRPPHGCKSFNQHPLFKTSDRNITVSDGKANRRYNSETVRFTFITRKALRTMAGEKWQKQFFPLADAKMSLSNRRHNR